VSQPRELSMSENDEKDVMYSEAGSVQYSQENSNLLFKELEKDPSDHTSGRLAKRYANQDGVLDAAGVQKLLHDYKNVLVKTDKAAALHQQASLQVQHANESNAETTARLKKQKAEALEKWKLRQPTLVPFVEVMDSHALSRLFPTEIETRSLADVVETKKPSSIMAEEELRTSGGKFSEEEQYTWDMCLVFRLGEDKPLKFQLTEPPSEEEIREYPKAGPKKTIIETTEREHYQGIIASTIDSLERAGLRLFLFLSIQRDEVYCFVGADERRLSQEADRINMAIRLDREAMIKHGQRVGMALAKRTDVPVEAWENIFAKFRDFKAMGDPREDIYAKQDEGPFHANTPFHHVNRLKLTESIIKADDILGGAGLQLRRQIRNPRDPLAAYFPLQHNPQLKILKAKALRFGAVWNPPTRELAAYYGEQVTLYFVFLSTYFKWLLLASAIGIVFTAYQISIEAFDGPGLSVFGIIMVGWATMFLEVLKRKMASFRVEFGMSNFLEQETVRAEFDGEWVLSPISGKLEEVFPFWEAVKRKLVSVVCVGLYICCALGAVIGIFALRAALANTEMELGEILAIAGVVNGLQIQIFNFVYARVSVGLNDWENHRTDSQYENFLIAKSFFFKVINSFATFIYIGFYKRFDDSVKYCKGSYLQRIAKLNTVDKPAVVAFESAWVWNTTSGIVSAANPYNENTEADFYRLFEIVKNEGPNYRGDCFGELAYQLGIIFGMMIVVNNTVEILGPVVGKFLQNRAQTKDGPQAQLERARKGNDAAALEMAERKMRELEALAGPINEQLAKITDPSKQSDAENEFEYTQYEGTFADYDELIIQFGFVVLFVVVFPAAPILALFNNIIEFRLDASKLMSFTRRPHPKGTFDMGTWYSILNLLSWVMVVSNTALIVFSSNQARTIDSDLRWVTFVIVEHILIGIKLLIEFFVPDVPTDVEEKLARQDVVRVTLIEPNY
jgi:hypothetical protein